jgi:hypothetical protein
MTDDGSDERTVDDRPALAYHFPEDPDTPVGHAGEHPGNLMVRLDRPRTDTRTRLAVVADPHLAIRETGTSKLFEHTETHLRNAFDDIGRRDVDHVVSVGDITKDGEPRNYGRFDELLADLDAPFLSVPGNHDVPKAGDEHETIPVEEYAERYAPAQYPFVHRVGGLDLVCLNSSGTEEVLYDSHDGLVTEEDVSWLRETLPDPETPVVVTQFDLPATSDRIRGHRDAVEREMTVQSVLRDPEPFVDALATNDVPRRPADADGTPPHADDGGPAGRPRGDGPDHLLVPPGVPPPRRRAARYRNTDGPGRGPRRDPLRPRRAVG